MGTNKGKARALAVGWWQLDLAQRYREKGFVNCSLVSYHEIPEGEGFLCNPMTADDSKPAMVCEDCFDGYQFDPWDGGQSGVRAGPYTQPEQALSMLEVGTRTVWRLNRDGMGPKPKVDEAKERGGGVEVPPVYVKPAPPEEKKAQSLGLIAGVVVVVLVVGLVLYLLLHASRPHAAAAAGGGAKSAPSSAADSGWGDIPAAPAEVAPPVAVPPAAVPPAATAPAAPGNDDWGSLPLPGSVAPAPANPAPANPALPPTVDPRLADLAKQVDERVRAELAAHPVGPQQVAEQLKLGWPVPKPLATPQAVEAAIDKAAEQQVARQFPPHDFVSEAAKKYRLYQVGETVTLWLQHNRQGTTAEQLTGVIHEVTDNYVKIGDRTIYKADLDDGDRIHFDEMRSELVTRDYVKTETARYQQMRKDALPAADADLSPKFYTNAGYIQVNNAWLARTDYLAQQVEAARQAQAAAVRARAEAEIFGAAGFVQRDGQWMAK